MPRGAWAAVGATAGAIAAETVGPAALIVAVGLALASSMLVRTGLRQRALRGLLMAGAAGLVLARGLVGPDAAEATAPPLGQASIEATVESIASPRDGRRSALLVTDRTGEDQRLMSRLPLLPRVEPGMRIVVDGDIAGLPDGGYGDYLRRIGAVALLDVESIRLVSGGQAGPGAWLERLRRAGGDALAAVLPEPAAGLAAGIVIGLRDRVDRDLAADFTTAGVSHVVAISGWNIAIVAGAVMAASSRLHRRRRVLLAVATISVYTVFAGATPSVVRAAVMAGVALLAREAGRPAIAAAALGWAATILLVSDPAMVLDPGFQLSVLGTAGLIAWADPLESRVRQLTRGRLPAPVAESLAISLAAQAATLPVVLATFGRFATVAPLVNLVVVPLIPPMMAGAVVALGAGLAVDNGLPEAIGTVIGLPAWALASLAIGAVRFGAALPGANLAVGPPFDALAGASTAILLLAVARRPQGGWRLRRRRARRLGGSGAPPSQRASVHRGTAPGARRATRDRRPIVVSLVTIAVAISAAATAAAATPDGALRIVVLDVGQGDAILVQGPRGGRLLVDGGPDPDRLRVRLDERLPPWDRRLDAVVLTHPHEDHVAGMLALAARYRVGRFYEPGMRGPGPGYGAWRDALAAAGAITLPLATGDRLTLDGVGLRVLWPDRGSVPDEPADDGTAVNNVSIVLLGTVGRQRFLLTGDIEEGVDPRLLARGLPAIDVLKVAHHGSRTATSAAFLEAVRPTMAVISAGRGNPYGHPTKATIGRLATGGARVLRTDLDGSVTIRLDGASLGHGTTRGRTDTSPPQAGPVMRGPLVAGGLGCLIRPAPAEPPTASGDEDGLGYHRRDAGRFVPRAEIGDPDRLPARPAATCDQPPLIRALGRRRRARLLRRRARPQRSRIRTEPP
jgi:competence protein ComEC